MRMRDVNMLKKFCQKKKWSNFVLVFHLKIIFEKYADEYCNY